MMHHRSLVPMSANTRIGLRTGGVYDGKIAGLYDLEETLGRGHFAVVKLARHVFTGEKVAVKVIDKSKLDEVSKAHLFQEVRCMKLVQHPNVVRLYEVIDTATKLYLILELGDGGDLYDYIMRHDTGLSETVAREYFRQIVRAITYCHQLHVVHRDLKPENVVFFQKQGVVKLTDFGFSNKFCPGQKLETSCGSLAYSAPEILLGDSYDAPAVDVWSLGVILYMLVCGQAPFQEANDSETLTMIMDCKYSVPQHVSEECVDLISRMLVRAPEKRATLSEISAHPWLLSSKQENHADILPLVSREQLSEEDHNFIVQKIVNGNIATKEEIQECLDKNEYNHITATYFLLAERKLRSKRVEQYNKNKRPENLAVPQSAPAPARDANVSGPNPCLLSVPRTPGDLPQRSRKCSIVVEDEEEEDLSGCSGREELTPAHCSLDRRGSGSEGRLNIALQERLAESERRKQQHIDDAKRGMKMNEKLTNEATKIAQNNQNNNNNTKWKRDGNVDVNLDKSVAVSKILTNLEELNDTPTTIITDSSTISIPIISNTILTCPTTPKYKTMPSPTRTTIANPLQLNEIFEEGECDGTPRTTSRQFVGRNQTRSAYEQRRSKFHKSRTASCSSSDASDDDSENRKKRAHKLNAAAAKPLPGRRDSHDDSSDSQEPGTGAGASSGGTVLSAAIVTAQSSGHKQQENRTQKSSSGTNSSNGKKNCNDSAFGRRHKISRRRTGETRLRESQSLNRITEVQEDTHAIVISTSITATQGASVVPKVKGFGARLLQGFSSRTKVDDKVSQQHVSRKDKIEAKKEKEEKENCEKLLSDKCGSKKMKLLSKYFQVHKKLCIPFPGIFSRNRLYKAQSCSSLSRDKISNSRNNVGGDAVELRKRQRAISVARNSAGVILGHDDGDINQNMGYKGDKRKSAPNVQFNGMCNDITDICTVHLGQASKCSFG